jgi:hypothetical protein
VTTNNCTSLTGLHTIRITVIAAYIKSPVFSIRFRVTGLKDVLRYRPHRLANIAQLSFLQLSTLMAAISRQTIFLTNWRSQITPLITSWHGQQRKHRASLLYFKRYRGNMFICEAVTRQQLLYICLFRGSCPATVLHVTTTKITILITNELNFHTLCHNRTVITSTIVSLKRHGSVCIS